MMANVKDPEAVPEACKELATVDPREALRIKQRELNKEKNEGLFDKSRETPTGHRQE